MFDSVYVGKKAKTLRSTSRFTGYSKVVLIVTEELEYTAGNDTGRTLTMSCPWGTQKLANDILARIRGFQYQPYEATGAQVDPSAEMGDAVTVSNVYGGIYAQDISFGPAFVSDISAPEDEEIDHEYPYQSQQDRKVVRQANELRASLQVNATAIKAEAAARESDMNSVRSEFELQAKSISAKVSSTGGDASSFGWTLLDDSWTVQGSGRDVFKVTKDGAEVYGILRATGGTIGGFDIGANALTYNGQTWKGSNSRGAYLGTSGLQLGNKFRVDMYGNLEAASGTFEGTIYAGKIAYGDDYGKLDGDGIVRNSIYGSRIATNTIGTTYLSDTVNTNLGYANFANGVFNGTQKPTWIKTQQLTVADYNCGWTKISYKDHSGANRTIRVLAGQ